MRIRFHLLIAAAAAAALVSAQVPGEKDMPKTDAPAAATSDSPLSFKARDIDGNEVDLAKYKGKVVLIVNVASRCGYTPQYEQLQALHTKYGKDGLQVLGFPSNDFGRQEPGTEAEIKSFCQSKYSVTFDMFSKVAVKGDEAHPLYKFLTSTERNGAFGGDIRWNFTKFLVDRQGKVIARFESKVRPDSKELVEAVEKALKS